MLTHEKSNIFKCEICKKAFSEKLNLQQHILSVHEKSKPFKCELCGKSFPQKAFKEACDGHSSAV